MTKVINIVEKELAEVQLALDSFKNEVNDQQS